MDESKFAAMRQRSLALREAADLLGSEVRWQRELESRGSNKAAAIAERMEMHERILRNWSEGAMT